MNGNKRRKWLKGRVTALTLGIAIMILFFTLIVIELTVKVPLDADGNPAPVTTMEHIAQWAKGAWDIEGVAKNLSSQFQTISQCVVWIVVVGAATTILRYVFKTQKKKDNRTKTVITLVDGFVKYGGAIAIIMLILKACGVNTAALWASAGILALIIGLGAQSLIADIIAGIFIIFEDEYTVGEIIAIDDFRGKVIEIGIRATKLLDTAGNIKIINNSDIKNVVNMSRELSLAVVECEFPYDVPIEKVEAILKNNLDVLKEKIPAIVEGPFYKGVSQYEASNVAVKLVAQCHEEDRFQVQRDLLREYRILFVNNGFDLSYEQVVINQPVEKKLSVSSKDKKNVEDFVSNQKELSSELDEQSGGK